MYASLKTRVLQRVKDHREDANTRAKRLKELNESITKLNAESVFFNKNYCAQRIDRYISSVETISLFAKGTVFFDFDKHIFRTMQNDIFHFNKKMLQIKEIGVSELRKEDGQTNCIKFLEDANSNLHFDVFANNSISEYYKYRDVLDSNRKRMTGLDSFCKCWTKEWQSGVYMMMYFNKDLFTPVIQIEENCVQEIPYLNKDEIDAIINSKYIKDGVYYITVNNNVKIPCSYEECFEYIKESKFKLLFHYKIAKARTTFGAMIHIKPN